VEKPLLKKIRPMDDRRETKKRHYACGGAFANGNDGNYRSRETWVLPLSGEKGKVTEGNF